MPTIKVFTADRILQETGFAEALPDALPQVARIMATSVDKVHIMGVPCITGPGVDVAHVQVEYLPLATRTEAFMAAASDELAAYFATLLRQPVRLRAWPTHGVAMASAQPVGAGVDA